MYICMCIRYKDNLIYIRYLPMSIYHIYLSAPVYLLREREERKRKRLKHICQGSDQRLVVFWGGRVMEYLSLLFSTIHSYRSSQKKDFLFVSQSASTFEVFRILVGECVINTGESCIFYKLYLRSNVTSIPFYVYVGRVKEISGFKCRDQDFQPCPNLGLFLNDHNRKE